MAGPDRELRGEGEGEGGGGLLALLAFLPSLVSSSFTQNRKGAGGWATSGPSLRSGTEYSIINTSGNGRDMFFEDFQ